MQDRSLLLPDAIVDLSDRIRIGSQTAKDGFRNEALVVDRFNQWQTDETAQAWLLIMGYAVQDIEWVRAAAIPGSFKADVQVQVTIKLTGVLGVENLQVKLVSQKTGFNQIDKRWLKSYAELWDMPEEIVTLFRRFTGEIPPTVPTRDPRRMFADEFTAEERNQLVRFLHNNQTLIVSDILKGRGKFSAEWFLVILRTNSTEAWALKPINYVLNFFGNGEIEVTSRGSFRIGRITLQRKGGDGGRNTANMLQFKINPALLIVPETHES